MKRRAFLKTSVIFGGGMVLGQQDLQILLKDQRIRIGIIGYGDRGSGIKSILIKMPEFFELKAICDTLDFRLDKARNDRELSQVKVLKNYHEILEDKNIDAVIIATTLSEHFRIAKDALQAGKHIYLEKTMTYNKEEALELQSLAINKHTKQIIQIGHQYRYSPLYYKVRDVINSGVLGKVTQIECRWDRNSNWRRPVPSPKLERLINWRMYKEYSGGLAAELLSHQIDFINWAFDTHPDEIYSVGGIDYYKDGRETYDNIQAVLRYRGKGMIASFGATCANKKDGFLFKIKGSKGTISLLPSEGLFYPEKGEGVLETVDGVTGATKLVTNNDGGIPILQNLTKDGTWYAFQEFYKNIKEGKLPESNIYTGTKTTICVDLINVSAYTGTIQKWKPEYAKI